MKPFVKWAGGKRQILDRIRKYIDEIEDREDSTYIEPFLGGGAVFFNLAPSCAIINDLNEDLINAYKVIKSDKYTELIELLKDYKEKYFNDKDGTYYDTRQLDREEGWPNNHTDVERAARMIFLNRTCYNGLYRVNSKGQFNTPIGRYSNPMICDEQLIKEIHNYLSSNNIEIMCGSYEYAIKKAKDKDIIYVDPPYDYEDDDGFTKYQEKGFTFEDFEKLKKVCDKAIRRGASVIISNNATTKVIELFQADIRYKIYYDELYLNTLRTINSVVEGRKSGREVIICGMDVTFPQANDLNKVIALAMADDKALNDKILAKQVIGVSTDRQVSYYMSALSYFGYITKDKKFHEGIEQIRNNKDLIEEDIFEKLTKDDKFNKVYKKSLEQELKTEDIKEILKEDLGNHLSETTIMRRASTVKSWVEWMVQHTNNNK